LRFHHRLGDDVLAGDQLDLGLLALQLGDTPAKTAGSASARVRVKKRRAGRR
jgi:hypothetical protein